MMNIKGTRANEPLDLGLNMYARPLALRVAITFFSGCRRDSRQ